MSEFIFSMHRPCEEHRLRHSYSHASPPYPTSQAHIPKKRYKREKRDTKEIQKREERVVIVLVKVVKEVTVVKVVNISEHE